MRLGDTGFFHLLERLAAATNSNRDCDEWQAAGIRWRRQRHIHWSQTSFQIEVHELCHAARPRWELLFVHEIWWALDRRTAMRNSRWTHLRHGTRRDVLAWFQARQEELDRH
jgi:hypothetical protein